MLKRIFSPATRVMGRLRYARKFVVIAVVLLLPLGLVSFAFLREAERRYEFSERERLGVRYISPTVELLAAVSIARDAAVSGAAGQGRGDLAQARRDVVTATNRLAEVDSELGATLRTTELWQPLRARIDTVLATAQPDAEAATDAYGQLTSGLTALVVRAGDSSNLILDPDLDSFYVMDAVVNRVPGLMDAVGAGAAQATLLTDKRLGAKERMAHRIDTAVLKGVIQNQSTTMRTGHQTAFTATKRSALRPTLEPQLVAANASLDKVVGELDRVVTSEVSPPAPRAAVEALLTLHRAESGELTALLETRLAGIGKLAMIVQVAVLLGLLLATYLFVGFYLSVAGSLARMRAAVSAARGGDFTRTARVTTRDEVATMAGELDELLGDLRGVVADLAGKAERLGGASSRLGTVAAQLDVRAAQTSSQAATARGDAAQVDSHVQTMSAASEQMSASIREIASSAASATTVAGQAVEVAAATTTSVEGLGQASREIGEIVRVITAVAEQTNLLALNATIEAARAGDAGKGFAVVAGEVKELANETARATQDIAGRIVAIQSSGGAAAEGIDKIARVIDDINATQSSIAAAIEEQTATTAEIARNVADVARGTGSIVAAVAGVTQAAEATAGDAVETRRAADDLDVVARDLRALAGRFRY